MVGVDEAGGLLAVDLLLNVAVQMVVVPLIDVEGDGDMVADGDRLENGDGAWIDGIVVGGARVVGRRRHWCGRGGLGILEKNRGL
jgi:hypothetical protein